MSRGELPLGNPLHPSGVISIRSHIKYIRQVVTHCLVSTTREPEGNRGRVINDDNPGYPLCKQRITAGHLEYLVLV